MRLPTSITNANEMRSLFLELLKSSFPGENVIFTQPYISKIKMKTLNLIEDLSPSVAGTGNFSNLGLAQMSVWCLMILLKPGVIYVVLKHPYQRCAKNAKASFILCIFSVCGFDRKSC